MNKNIEKGEEKGENSYWDSLFIGGGSALNGNRYIWQFYCFIPSSSLLTSRRRFFAGAHTLALSSPARARVTKGVRKWARECWQHVALCFPKSSLGVMDANPGIGKSWARPETALRRYLGREKGGRDGKQKGEEEEEEEEAGTGCRGCSCRRQRAHRIPPRSRLGCRGRSLRCGARTGAAGVPREPPPDPSRWAPEEGCARGAPVPRRVQASSSFGGAVDSIQPHPAHFPPI